MKMITTLKLKRETKGAILYEEVDEHGSPIIAILGSMYVRKDALRQAQHATPPNTIEVTIEAK